MKDYSVSVNQARYDTSIMVKYMNTATINKSKKFYNTTFPYDMIFTKDYASTSDKQVENFARKFNIQYRACIVYLIYLLSTRVDLSFSVHKLAKISSNRGKVYFEGMVHLLRYIRYNKTLCLKDYAEMKDASLSDLLIQAIINTEKQLMKFSDSSWQDCTDTGRSTGSYIIFYKGGPIDHGTHVPGPVSQSISKRLVHFIIHCRNGFSIFKDVCSLIVE